MQTFFNVVIKLFFLLGKRKLSEDNQTWQAIPFLCFQNDLSLELALKVGFNINQKISGSKDQLNII